MFSMNHLLDCVGFLSGDGKLMLKESLTPASRNFSCSNKERWSIHVNRRHLGQKYYVTRPAMSAARFVMMVQWEKIP